MEFEICMTVLFCGLCFFMGTLKTRLDALEKAMEEGSGRDAPGENAASPGVDPRLAWQLENLLRYDGSPKGQKEADA